MAFYYPWIDCIIQTSKESKGNVNIVNEKCDKVAKALVPSCVEEDDLIFGSDFDLRSENNFQIDRCSKDSKDK